MMTLSHYLIEIVSKGMKLLNTQKRAEFFFIRGQCHHGRGGGYVYHTLDGGQFRFFVVEILILIGKCIKQKIPNAQFSFCQAQLKLASLAEPGLAELSWLYNH